MRICPPFFSSFEFERRRRRRGGGEGERPRLLLPRERKEKALEILQKEKKEKKTKEKTQHKKKRGRGERAGKKETAAHSSLESCSLSLSFFLFSPRRRISHLSVLLSRSRELGVERRRTGAQIGKERERERGIDLFSSRLVACSESLSSLCELNQIRFEDGFLAGAGRGHHRRGGRSFGPSELPRGRGGTAGAGTMASKGEED